MLSPSDTKFDSTTLDVSAIPSTSKQQTALFPSEGIKYDPDNIQPKTLITSGQTSTLSSIESIKPYEIPQTSGVPTMQLYPSSKIEYVQNNGISETPFSPIEQIPARWNSTFRQRVNTLLSEWSLHIYNFLSQVCAPIIVIELWFLPHARRFVFLMILIFCVVWIWILQKTLFKRGGSSTGPALEERPVADVVKRPGAEGERNLLEFIQKLEEYWRTH